MVCCSLRLLCLLPALLIRSPPSSLLFSNNNSDDFRLSGLYEPGFPLLHRFFWIQDRFTEQFLPNLYLHLRKLDIMTDSFSTQFYTTLFVPCLPYEYVLRIWDLFMAEGVCILFRAILAILKLGQELLLKSDFEGAFNYFRGLCKRQMVSFSPDDLIRTMSEFKLITPSRVEKLERKYQDSVS